MVLQSHPGTSRSGRGRIPDCGGALMMTTKRCDLAIHFFSFCKSIFCFHNLLNEKSASQINTTKYTVHFKPDCHISGNKHRKANVFVELFSTSGAPLQGVSWLQQQLNSPDKDKIASLLFPAAINQQLFTSRNNI
jgi:hypothetical protein